MLDVHPRAPFVRRIEIQSGELGTGRAVRGPSRQPFTWIGHVAVLVQIAREPDVVVQRAAAVFHDVDVPIVIHSEVVGVGERQSDRVAGGEVCGAAVGEHRDGLAAQVDAVNLVRRRGRHVDELVAAHFLKLHVLRPLIVGPIERGEVCRVARIHGGHAVDVSDGDRSRQSRALRVGERHPAERSGRVRRVPVGDAQHEGLAGGEVLRVARHDVTEARRWRVAVDVAAVELVDEVHVPSLVELDAFVRSARHDRAVHEAGERGVARRRRRMKGRRIDRIPDLEQAAVGAGAALRIGLPGLFGGDQRAPRRPVAGVE